MSSQAKNIKEKISANFHYQPEAGKIYTYDDALTRHKMALLNTVVKNGKSSERAYTCLKMAWLCRGKRELLMQGDYKKEEVTELLMRKRNCSQMLTMVLKQLFQKKISQCDVWTSIQ